MFKIRNPFNLPLFCAPEMDKCLITEKIGYGKKWIWHKKKRNSKVKDRSLRKVFSVHDYKVRQKTQNKRLRKKKKKAATKKKEFSIAIMNDIIWKVIKIFYSGGADIAKFEFKTLFMEMLEINKIIGSHCGIFFVSFFFSPHYYKLMKVKISPHNLSAPKRAIFIVISFTHQQKRHWKITNGMFAMICLIICTYPKT